MNILINYNKINNNFQRFYKIESNNDQELQSKILSHY